MRRKHFAHRSHTGGKRRRALALMMTMMMLFTLAPSSVFALATDSSDYLGGHTHNKSCGYITATEGASCAYTNTHDSECGYCEGSSCTFMPAAMDPVLIQPPWRELPANISAISQRSMKMIIKRSGRPMRPSTYTRSPYGASCAELCAALPETLPGTVECSEDTV